MCAFGWSCGLLLNAHVKWWIGLLPETLHDRSADIWNLQKLCYVCWYFFGRISVTGIFSFFRFESSKNQSHLWSMSDRTRVKVLVLWKKLAWPAQLSTTPWRLKGTVYVCFVLTVAGRFDSSCFDTGFLYWVLCLKNKGFSPKMFLLLHANYAQSNQNFLCNFTASVCIKTNVSNFGNRSFQQGHPTRI